MDEIVKVCKVHGELTVDKCYIDSRVKKKSIYCILCRRSRAKKTYRNHAKKNIETSNRRQKEFHVDKLSDFYISVMLSRQLNCNRNDVSQGLIDLKRAIIMLKSETRIQQNKATEADLRRKLNAIKEYK